MNRKIVNFLLVLFIAFTLYNTLIPFQFEFDGENLSRFLTTTQLTELYHLYKGNSKTDLIGNIILFMPLGFLLYFWRRQRRLHAPIAYSTIIGFMFSLFIEFLQSTT